jgi:plastocyanin domain-containing protein
MTPAEWLVLAGGIAAIAWVNWYFFLAGRTPAHATALVQGVQEVTIQVQGGYDPSAVKVSADRPVRLVFDRQEASGCSEEVVLGDFGIRKFLPPFQKTAVEFTPSRPGAFEFTCGMGMLRGKIVVEEGKSA